MFHFLQKRISTLRSGSSCTGLMMNQKAEMTGESHQLRTKCAWNQVCLDLGYWAAWTSTRRNYKKNFALSSLHPMRFFWRPLSYAHWWGPLAQQWWQFWVSHWMGGARGTAGDLQQRSKHFVDLDLRTDIQLPFNTWQGQPQEQPLENILQETPYLYH